MKLTRLLVDFCLPFWKQILLLIGIIVDAQIPKSYRKITDDLVSFQNEPSPEATSQMLEAVGTMLYFIVVGGVLSLAENYLKSHFGENLTHNVRTRVYHTMQQVSIEWYTHNKSGELTTLFNHDIWVVCNYLSHNIPRILYNCSLVAFTFHTMYQMNHKLTILTLFVIPSFYFPSKWIGSKIASMKQEGFKIRTKMNNWLSDTLSINGQLLVKNFGQQGYAEKTFEDYSNQVKALEIRRSFLYSLFSQFLFFCVIIGTVSVFLVGLSVIVYYYLQYEILPEKMKELKHLKNWEDHIDYNELVMIAIEQSELTTGVMVAFAAYINKLYSPLYDLGNTLVDLEIVSVALGKVYHYLDKSKTKSQVLQELEKLQTIQLEEVKGFIEFKNVSFKYIRKFSEESERERGSRRNGKELTDPDENPVEKWAIREVSFEVSPEQIVLIAGPNGAGKSTICNLLTRLYEPTEGNITLDGYNLKNLRNDTITKHIGVLTQETFLLHDTVKNNLLFANPQASADQILECCQKARLDEVIDQLPFKYETIVGERAYALSGGERQRLAIARLFLKNPSVMILDEFNSFLDPENEKKVIEAIRDFVKKNKKTCIIISHHQIPQVDKTVLMDKGKIVQVS